MGLVGAICSLLCLRASPSGTMSNGLASVRHEGAFLRISLRSCREIVPVHLNDAPAGRAIVRFRPSGRRTIARARQGYGHGPLPMGSSPFVGRKQGKRTPGSKASRCLDKRPWSASGRSTFGRPRIPPLRLCRRPECLAGRISPANSSANSGPLASC
jgi:hypothetical protein